MAVRWSSEFYTAMEHRDLQANAMAVDITGTYVLLAGRRYIAIKNLDDTYLDNVKKFPRQSKYDVNAAEWNPTSYHSELCVISSNQRLEVLTWHQGELTILHALRAHTRVITDLNWHKFEPNLLASCSADTFIHIWDMRDPRRPVTSLSAVAEASQVQWNRISGNLLATAHDGDVKLWDQRKGTAPVQYISAHLSKIHGLDWNPKIESQLATCSQDNTVKFFDINNPRRAEFVLATSAPVWRARFTPFGNGMITVVVPQLRRGENSLLLWNTTNRTTPIHTFIGHRDVVLEFEWLKRHPDENDFQLVTWSKDQTLLVWRIEPFLQKLCGHDLDHREKEPQILEPARSKNIQKIQPLQQEFSLLNVQIPNLDVVKMDVTKRVCVVKGHANSFTLTLHITFPIAYPNGVSPVFQLDQGSNLEEGITSQILHTITNTAQQRVSKNRTCLEPCLRQFVSTLEQLLNPSDEQSHKQTYIEPNVLSSFNDACVPFPKTSGAKFCSASVLVCFERRVNYRRNSVKVDSATPRALSALSNTFSTRRSTENMSVFSFYLQRQRSRLNKNIRLAQKSLVTVYNAAGLFPVSKTLGEKYILDGEISRICSHNAQMAESVGRLDLVQAWTLMNLIINPYQNEHEVISEHPFGNQLIQSLIRHYATNLDLQTAAMLSCVYGKGQDETLSKKSVLRNLSSGQLASGKKWLKSGSSPYHTIPPADIVADGWVVPFLRSTRSSSLDNLRLEKLATQIIMPKSPISTLYEYYKLAYAEMLHRWGLLYNRAEVLKYMCTPVEIHRGVEFVTDCQKCKQPARGSSCINCKRISLECVICHVSVKGSANCCLVCGHGGHTRHMQQWFNSNYVCPSGCGCKCLIETAVIFSY